MANLIYPIAKQGFLGADIDAEADIRAILVDLADYTYSAAHDNLDDVAAASRVAVSGALGSITITNGTLDTADFSFTSVSGDVSEAIILYRHTGTESTSRLIAFYDTGVGGLPITPNGQNIAVTVNASGWLSL